MENQDLLAIKDPPDHKENLVLREKLESPVILVLSKARKDQQGKLESQVGNFSPSNYASH